MSLEDVSNTTAIQRTRLVIPNLFIQPNTIQEGLTKSTLFHIGAESSVAPFVLYAYGATGDLPHTDLRLFQYEDVPAGWNLQISLSKYGSVKEKQIIIAYKGKPTEESSRLRVTISGLNKYFTLDLINGLFKVAKTWYNANEEVGEETIEIQNRLLDLIKDTATFNHNVEDVQKGDRVIFHRFEFDQHTNRLGFQIDGFPTRKSTRTILLPVQVGVNLDNTTL